MLVYARVKVARNMKKTFDKPPASMTQTPTVAKSVLSLCVRKCKMVIAMTKIGKTAIAAAIAKYVEKFIRLQPNAEMCRTGPGQQETSRVVPGVGTSDVLGFTKYTVEPPNEGYAEHELDDCRGNHRLDMGSMSYSYCKISATRQKY